MSEAEVADDFALNAFRDPFNAAVIAVGHTTIGLAMLETFRDKPDPRELLRRASAVSPQSAFLARTSEIVFAGSRPPRTHRGVEFAHFHDPGLFFAKPNHPVKPITAHVN